MTNRRSINMQRLMFTAATLLPAFASQPTMTNSWALDTARGNCARFYRLNIVPKKL